MLRKAKGYNSIFSLKEIDNYTYIGKDIGILENHYCFLEYKIIDNKIICRKKQESIEKKFKLIDIYNYINNLARIYINKERNVYEIILDLCINLGVPMKYLVQKTQDFYVFGEDKEYYVDEKYINYCEKCFKTIHSILSSRKIKVEINNYYKYFPVYYRNIKNSTLVTEYKPIICSESVFNLFFSTLVILNFYTYNNNLKNPFICNECGKAFERKTNNQRYCDICKSKIDFPKMSRKQIL